MQVRLYMQSSRTEEISHNFPAAKKHVRWL